MKSAVVRVSPPSETAESSDDLEETPEVNLAVECVAEAAAALGGVQLEGLAAAAGRAGHVEPLVAGDAVGAVVAGRLARNPNQSPGAAARRCGVHFGGVQVFHHRLSLDDSKLPSDGLAPVGLGPLQRSEVRRLNSYEADRERCRQGVGLIPPDRRREAIIGSSSSGIKRTDKLERIERTNRELKRSQQDSILDHLNALRRRPPASVSAGRRKFTVFDAPGDGDGEEEESEEEVVAAAAVVEEGGEADDDDDDDDDDDSDDEEVEEVVEEGAARFFGEHLGGWQPAG